MFEAMLPQSVNAVAQALLIVAAMLMPSLAQALQLSAARLWPSPDYTRLTLEASQPIAFKYFMLGNPHRLVLDLQGVEPGSALNTLAQRVDTTDPYVTSVRVGINRPGVVRLVLELKTQIKPSIFQLKPFGEYGHRLVLDLYPEQPPDALAQLGLGKKPEDVLAGIGAAPARPEQAEPPAAVDAPGTIEIPLPQGAAVNPESDPLKLEAFRRAAKSGMGKRAVRPIIVAIDAGHGGEDPGAKGATGSYEKHVTLAIARRVKHKLDAEENMRGVLIRDGDYFIPLAGRVNKARGHKADLFVSIHADAFIRPEARGSSVFALSEHGATSAAARWLAKKENEADLIGGVNIDVKDQFLKRTLIDLTQTATINDGLKLARSVLREIGGINTLHKNDVEQAGFAVLKAPDIPSILVETAFISNPEEERRLNDDAYQDKLAQAIVVGIKNYFGNAPSVVRTRLTKN